MTSVAPVINPVIRLAEGEAYTAEAGGAYVLTAADWSSLLRYVALDLAGRARAFGERAEAEPT